jgi:hypothetical protein
VRFELLLAQMGLRELLVLETSVFIDVYLAAIVRLLIICPLIKLEHGWLVLYFLESVSNPIL